MLWSDWLPVTTPDVRMSLVDFEAAVTNAVDTELRRVNERLNRYQTIIDQVLANTAANGLIGDTDLRGQAWAHRADILQRLDSITGGASASLLQVWSVATNTETALALFSTTVNATLDGHTATLSTYGTAIASLNGYVAAAWGVKLTVDGYVSGVQLINGGSGSSAFIVSADVFKVAFPGVTGGSPVDVFTVSNVSGSPKAVLKGDMYADGVIVGRAIAAATITGAKIDADTIETNHLIVNSVTKQAYATHTSGGKTSNTAFVTATLTTKSDKISITWTSGIHEDSVSSAQGLGATYEFRVKVDGTLIKAFVFKAGPFTSFPGSTNNISSLHQTFTLESVIESLTPGSHTFTIEYYHALAGQTSAPLEAGWIRIQDMYR